MINIKNLKEKASELDLSELNPLERAIVAFFAQSDMSPVMSALEGYSDAEAFEIYRQILGEDKPDATYFIGNKELSIENDKLDIFLIGRNIRIDIKDEELEFISELGRETIDLVLKVQDDKIVATAPDKVQFKKHLEQALSKLSSVVKSQPINWGGAPKIMAIAVLGLSLSACAKAVWTEGTNLTPTGPATPISNLPSQPQFVTMNFANYGSLNSGWPITEDTNLELPQEVFGFSFEHTPNMPTLNVLVNTQHVCSYVYSQGEYHAHASCLTQLELLAGDVLIVTGIPLEQTVTLKAKRH